MPIYHYQCSDCGHQLEALQRMSDPRLSDCPSCEKPALEKQLTAAAFKLNGSGWYETDFKNSSAKPKDSTKADSTAKEASKSSSTQSPSKSKAAAS